VNTKLLPVLSFSLCVLFQAASTAQSPREARSDTHQKNLSTPDTSTNLDAQLADTLRGITRVRLQRAIQLNAQVSGTYSADDIDTMKEQLATIDRQQGRNGQGLDWFSTLIGLAEISKSVADADVKRVAVLRQQNSVSDLDVEMARLRAQLADLNLKRGKLAAKGTADERQNWGLLYVACQVEQLKDQVRTLDARTN
jgi:hypothetical protein